MEEQNVGNVGHNVLQSLVKEINAKTPAAAGGAAGAMAVVSLDDGTPR